MVLKIILAAKICLFTFIYAIEDNLFAQPDTNFCVALRSHILPYPDLFQNRNFFSAKAIKAVEKVSRGEKYISDESGMREMSAEERKNAEASNLNQAIPIIQEKLKEDPNIGVISEDDTKEFILRASRLNFVRHDELPREIEASLEFERYRLYLYKYGIDPDARPYSFKNLLQQFGYSRLSHITEIESLPKILMDGTLIKPEKKQDKKLSWASEGSYIYLEALPRHLAATLLNSGRRQESDYGSLAKMFKIHVERVYFEFDSKVLDVIPWHHLNVHWQYGRMDAGHSILPSNMVGAFLSLQSDSSEINAKNNRWQFRNEFLMEEKIPCAVADHLLQ